MLLAYFLCDPKKGESYYMSEKSKILIVDDNEDEIFILKESLLFDLNNCDIFTEKDGRKALSKALEIKPHLILLDIQMPFINGFEVGNMLIKHEETKDIPIIFITAHFNTDEFSKYGYDINAIDFINKPVDTKMLATKIKLYLKIIEREWELRESEEQFRKLFNSTSDAILVYKSINGDTGKLLEANDVACKMLGYSRDELLNTPPANIYDDSTLSKLKTVIDTKSSHSNVLSEIYVKNSKGKEIPVEINSQYLEFKGTPAVLSVIRDITIRMEAEKIRRESLEKIKKNEALYRAVVEDQIEMIIRYKYDMTVTFTNNALIKQFNLDKNQIIGKKINEIHSELKVHNFEELHSKLNINNPIKVVEVSINKNTKDERWIRWTSRAIYDEDGDFIEYQSVGIDITGSKIAERKIKESEERFRELFNNMRSAVVTLLLDDSGNDFVITSINNAGKIIEQANKNIIIGQKLSRIIPRKRRKYILDIFKRVWKTSVPEDFFIDYLDNEYNLLSWREGNVYRLSTGEIVAVYDDITDRIKIEDEVLKRDIKHRFLLESIDTPILALKKNFDVLYCNDAYADIVGKSSMKIEQKNLFELYPDIKNEPVFKIYQDVLKNGETREIEYRKGKRYFLEMVYKTPWGIITILKDRTERREAEYEIHRLSHAVEQSPNSIILTNSEGLIIYVNPAFTNQTGYEYEDVEGRPPTFWEGTAKKLEIIYTEMMETIKSGKEFRDEIKLVRKDGKVLWESISVSPIFDENGLISNFLVILEDITARKAYESKINEINIELEKRVIERTKELNEAYTELDEKNKELEKRNRIIEYDLSLAKRVQQQIITHELPKADNFEFRTLYEPMEAVGGDFYEFIETREGQIGLFISDVSGHGAAAAFITSMLKILCSTYRRYSKQPAVFLSHINNMLCEKMADNYVTAFYCIFDPKTLTMKYSNAGHVYPILYRRRDKSVTQIEAVGGVIGVIDSLSYEQKEIQLEKGDRIIIYTDGLTEAHNERREIYGKNNLMEFMKNNNNYVLEEFIYRLYEDVNNFREGELSDDIAIIGIDAK